MQRPIGTALALAALACAFLAGPSTRGQAQQARSSVEVGIRILATGTPAAPATPSPATTSPANSLTKPRAPQHQRGDGTLMIDLQGKLWN